MIVGSLGGTDKPKNRVVEIRLPVIRIFRVGIIIRTKSADS